jgi:hypothetical protein
LTDLPKQDIQCILDTHKDGEVFEGARVLNADRLHEENIDTVIASNFAFQEIIMTYLRDDLGFRGEIVTFYTNKDTIPFDEM